NIVVTNNREYDGVSYPGLQRKCTIIARDGARACSFQLNRNARKWFIIIAGKDPARDTVALGSQALRSHKKKENCRQVPDEPGNSFWHKCSRLIRINSVAMPGFKPRAYTKEVQNQNKQVSIRTNLFSKR